MSSSFGVGAGSLRVRGRREQPGRRRADQPPRPEAQELSTIKLDHRTALPVA